LREPPDIRELIGDDAPDEQVDELRRVDRLLRSVPAPPHQVPPRLTQAVTSLTLPTPFWSRRRMALAVALAAALAAGFFGIGRLTSDPGVEARATVPLHPTQAAPEAAAVVQVGERDEKSGNWELILEVTGLPKLPGERYYTLWLEKDGEYAATCGSFNVGEGTTTVRMTVSYRLSQFDAWVISEHGDEPEPHLLRANVA
jgi:Anti-sigma-K factor rskA, C-terminal